jgi:hypothetical protein
MSDLLTHVGRLEMVDVDLNLEPQCASIHHPAGRSRRGRVEHSGPAAYWQVGPCAHSTGLRCAASVHTGRRHRGLSCSFCGASAPIEDFRFIEL